MILHGIQIITSPNCYETVIGDRLFPKSRHRSRRIHKKLVKRYGGECQIIRKPIAYKTGNAIYCHPSIYEEIKRKFGRGQRRV